MTSITNTSSSRVIPKPAKAAAIRPARVTRASNSMITTAAIANAAVTLESSTKIADNALHFDGQRTAGSGLTTQQLQDDVKYHYYFGGSISAHGDSVKVYKNYVFMTWYRGGKHDRHMMLSRLNTTTGVVKTIEFPHRHTGYQGNWWVGESHNTIGLAVSPKNGTIHMVFDMHAYSQTSHSGKFADDYFRYSYSLVGAADVPDENFTLDLFVKDTSAISQGPDDYKHLVMTRNLADKDDFSALTYPKFYETKEGDLLHYMRWGGNNNGAYYYNRYDADADKWTSFVPFNHKDQKSKGDAYNWGLYGEMKYVNGKLRVGFQRRSSNNTDKFQYQNGIYYAYLDDPANNVWRDHRGKQITWPLVNADEIKIFEPGDLVETTSTAANSTGTPPGKVSIVGNFDWTVTEKGDIHFIHLVKDNEFNKSVYGHLYKPAGATDFIHAPGITGASEINAIGDDVYIIGLKNGKPYVEVAKGGTTTFSEIYRDATTATKFQHGVPYVKNGKVYYYLMEEKPGSARPIHLQVIDLGINSADVRVSFDANELSLPINYSSLTINAKASDPSSSDAIDKVALYIDDDLISTLNSAPFTWTETNPKLQNLALGSYSIKAVTTAKNGQTTDTFMTLKVVETKPIVAFSESELSLEHDYSNINITLDASSPVATRSITSVTLSLNNQLVSSDFTAPYTWTETSLPLMNLALGSYTLKGIATDNTGETAETTMKLMVVDSRPVINFPNGDITLTEGYTSLVVNVQAETPAENRTITQVELFVNNQFIRKESVAPYDWGHTETLKGELLNYPIGTYTLKAIATDSEDLTAEATVKLTVIAKTSQSSSAASGSGTSVSGSSLAAASSASSVVTSSNTAVSSSSMAVSSSSQATSSASSVSSIIGSTGGQSSGGSGSMSLFLVMLLGLISLTRKIAD